MSKLETQLLSLFGTKNLYQILGLSKLAKKTEIKKAYFLLSLKFHPDRLEEMEKQSGEEKFQAISMIYGILCDEDKRRVYDETGMISEIGTWGDEMNEFFKPILESDTAECKKEYKGSLSETLDIELAYLKGNGNIQFILGNVPFLALEDVPRIQKIIEGL